MNKSKSLDATDIVDALEDLTEATELNAKAVAKLNLSPTIKVESPTIHVSSPAQSAPVVNVKVPETTVNVHQAKVSWRFKITKRDYSGLIEEFTATPE